MSMDRPCLMKIIPMRTHANTNDIHALFHQLLGSPSCAKITHTRIHKQMHDPTRHDRRRLRPLPLPLPGLPPQHLAPRLPHPQGTWKTHADEWLAHDDGLARLVSLTNTPLLCSSSPPLCPPSNTIPPHQTQPVPLPFTTPPLSSPLLSHHRR